MDLSNLLGGNKPQTADPAVVPVDQAPPVTPVEPVAPPVMPPPMPVTPVPVTPQPVVEPVVPAVPAQPVTPVATPDPEPTVAQPIVEPVIPEVPITPQPVVEPVAPEIPVVPVTPVAPVVPVVTTPSVTGGEVFEGIGSGKYKVVVLKDKCIGAASCVAVSPKTFELNDQQIAKVLPTVKTETDENLLLAAQSCPTLAIEVYDTATGEKIWPK